MLSYSNNILFDCYSTPSHNGEGEKNKWESVKEGPTGELLNYIILRCSTRYAGNSGPSYPGVHNSKKKETEENLEH